MKRPVGMVALLYGGGLWLGEFCKPPLTWLFAVALAFALTAIFLPRWRGFVLWPLLVLTGWTNFVRHTVAVSPQDLRAIQNSAPALATVRGTLAETPRRKLLVRDEQETWRTLAELRVESVRAGAAWRPAVGKMVVLHPGPLPENFFAGQRVEVTGVLAPPPGPRAEGLFDYQTYLRRQEIYFQLETETTNDWRLPEPARTTAPLSDRFAVWARAALARGLPAADESLRLEQALTLGDKSVLTEEVSEPFVRAATYHIFAVDGLRMAILFGIFFTLFRALRLPRWLAGALLIPLIWFYVALTGWPASAIRATVMLTVVIVGWALQRPSDLVNSLFAAALIILVWDPQQLFEAGFQLSFFVVLCIILVLPAFDRLGQRLLQTDSLLPEELRPRWQRWLVPPARFVLDLWFSSLAAWLGSIPLVAYYFHIITPVSAPANLLAVPLCGLVLTANLSSLLLAAWFPPAAELFNHAGWFLMETIRVTSRWCAAWPGAYYYVTAPDWFTTGLYYFTLLAVFSGWLFKPKFRVGKLAALLALTLAWGWHWQREHSATRLTILPLNGGSAVFCDAPGRTNDWLADCGNSNSVAFVLKPFLRAQGINRLPRLALTCGETRQIGGAAMLANLFPLGEIATGTAPFRSATCRRVLDELTRSSRRRRTLNCGDTFGRWTVLHPEADATIARAADNALVLRGDFPAARILLLSHLGHAGQAALLGRDTDLRADIVVAGLPGAGEPLGDALVSAIGAKLIILVDAEFPAQFRAGKALRERLAQRGVPVIYTREAGAVTITLRKGGWEARAMNGISFSSPGGG